MTYHSRFSAIYHGFILVACLGFIPVYVEPNAGIPRSGKGISYQVSPEEMAHYSKQFVSLGANIVGSCCGSTPEHIRKIAAII